METPENIKWHVYGLVDPETQQIRYVGFTHRTLKRRLSEHFGQLKRGEKTYKANWMKALAAKGLKPTIISLEEGTGPGAQDAEIRWIATLTEEGCRLTNLTDGGDGCIGHVHTEESKKLMSDKAKAVWADPEYLKLRTHITKEKWKDPEYRQAVITGMKLSLLNEEIKGKRTEAIRRSHSRPEVRENISKAITESYTPELLAIRSKHCKEMWENPEYKERMSQIMKDFKNTPEQKEKQAEINRLAWADPEKKQQRREAIKKALADPEVRKRKSEIAKEFCAKPEVKKKRSESQLKSWENKEIREKRSASSRRSWADPEIRERRREALRNGWAKRREKITAGK